MAVYTREVRFDGRVAIVTGAGAGLGREYAVLLAQRGAQVVINDISDVKAKETQEIIQKDGGKAIVVIENVGDSAGARRVVSEAVSTYGTIHIVINNAGNWMARYFHEYTDEEFLQCISTHFFACWYVCQAAWPYMKQQRYGRIINIASSSVKGPPNMAAYGSSKGAILGLSNSLAVEGKEFSIQVNTVGPAAFTKMTVDTLADSQPERLASLAQAMPAWAVARTVAWIASEDCKVTGHFIVAIGNSFAKMFLGETLGVMGPQDRYTIEFVRDNWEKGMDEQDYVNREDMMAGAPVCDARLQGILKPGDFK